MELTSSIEQADPIPENIFKRVSKVSCGWAVLRFQWADDLDT